MASDTRALAAAAAGYVAGTLRYHCTFLPWTGGNDVAFYWQRNWFSGTSEIIAGKRVVTNVATFYHVGSYAEWIATYGFNTGGWW